MIELQKSQPLISKVGSKDNMSVAAVYDVNVHKDGVNMKCMTMQVFVPWLVMDLSSVVINI